MRRKASVLSVISLIISIVAPPLFVLAVSLPSDVIFTLWVGLGYIAPFFPILSKFCRSRTGQPGGKLEIAALVVGLFNFYWLLYLTTRIDILIILAFVVLIAVFYGKAFNDKMNWTLWVQSGNATYIQIRSQIPAEVSAQLEQLRNDPQAVASYLSHCAKQGWVDRLFVDILQNEFAPLPPPTSPTATAPAQERIRFCRRCGQPLIDGSLFCSHCGTEIKRKEENHP